MTTLLIDPDFSALPGEVSHVFESAATRSFFNHPHWYRVFAETVAQPERRQVRLYAAQGVALVLAATAQPGGERSLAGLANYYSCEHELLRAPDALPGGAVELLRGILAERPRWEALRFTALDDPGAQALGGALRAAGLAVRRRPAFGTWYEETAGLGFAEYVAQRPSMLVNTWRRKRNKLAKAQRSAITVFDGGGTDGVETAVAAYETVYRNSWKGQEPYPRFMPALIRAAAQLGALRLGVVEVDGVPAAAQVWIVWQGRATIYKLAHDERFDDLSLGTILTMHMMEHVLERDRPREVDLGRGDDPYKKLWLPKRRQCWDLHAANPRTLGGLRLAARFAGAEIKARLRSRGGRDMTSVGDAAVPAGR
ncbi:MAG TPA: GNAT family N-acetyltransferase [Stellaceae bacterium]